jgi:tetratricopeptide (TPR) repeat protein
VRRGIATRLSQLVPRSAPLVLILLTVVAVTGFAAVSHLVSRFNANQQARGRRLYDEGLSAADARHFDDAIADFRAALTCDPDNSRYQLSLGRALRDSGDPRRLDEAESYLLALWQRTPQDAAINLALARVAARRGNVEDATRYYHNAMYGVWGSDADGSHRKARIELIQFLLQENSREKAESELIALAASLPPDPTLQLETARLFMEAKDYPNALARYQEALRLEPSDPGALAGAGEAAYDSGNYVAAQRYLHDAIALNPQDLRSKDLLASAELVIRANPFRSHISDAERNRRIAAALARAEDRLVECARQKGVALNGSSAAAQPPVVGTPSAAAPLIALQSRWMESKRSLARLRSSAESDLPDAIMDVVFQIEQEASSQCGPPEGIDQALLLISQKREATGQ